MLFSKTLKFRFILALIEFFLAVNIKYLTAGYLLFLAYFCAFFKVLIKKIGWGTSVMQFFKKKLTQIKKIYH